VCSCLVGCLQLPCCRSRHIYIKRYANYISFYLCIFFLPSLLSASLSLSFSLALTSSFYLYLLFFSPPSDSLSLPAATNLDSESKRTAHFQSSWQQHVNVFGSWSRPECVQELHQEAQLNLQSLLQGKRVSCRRFVCVFRCHRRPCLPESACVFSFCFCGCVF